MRKLTLITIAFAVLLGIGYGCFYKSVPVKYSARNFSFLSEQKIQSEIDEESAGMYEFFQEIRKNPFTDQISVTDIKNAYFSLGKFSSLRGSLPLQWEEVGPDNVGGRTRAILIDNQDATGNTIYAGGVSGGLWKSTNGGNYWYKINDLQENLIISSICQSPDGDIYYGTGEDGFYFASGMGDGGGFFGSGVYRSSDGGKTFKLLPATNPFGSGGSKWITVQSLAANPSSDRIYACTANGFYYSDDNGNTWTKPSGAGAPGNSLMMDVKLDKNGTVYISNAAVIWKSDDNLQTFTQITPKTTNTTGDPMGSSSRITIGISESNPNYLYLMNSDASRRLGGIFQSKDKGNTWLRIANRAASGVDFDPLGSTASSQGVYDQAIMVDPKNPERIFVAGVDMWEWRNPSVFKGDPKAGWSNPVNAARSIANDYYLHPDVHVFAIDSKHGNPFTTFIGSDGGITKSSDGMLKYKTMNNGYNVTQFYGCAANPLSKDASWERKVFGGTQDNSCQLITGRGNTKMSAITISGGDGFQCEGSQIFPEIMFYGSQNGNYLRSGNGGIDAQHFFDCRTIWQMDNRYGYGSSRKCEDKTNDFINYFNVPIEFKENFSDTTSLMAICANRTLGGNDGAIYITYDAIDLKKGTGTLWYNLFESNSYFNRIEISNTMKTIYASSGSRIIRIQGYDTINYPQDTRDSAWKVPLSSIDVKQVGNFSGVITGITEDINNPNHLVVSLGGYFAGPHVYETYNILDSTHLIVWKDISGSGGFSFPVYDVVVSNDNAKTIVVGTEFGIFASSNGGISWSEQNNGMARVPVLELRQYEDKPWEGPVLYAATHGRGIFVSNTLKTGFQSKINVSPVQNLQVYPNPASDFFNILFNTNTSANVFVSVIDMNGRKIYNGQFLKENPGNNNIQIGTSGWSSGIYLVCIKINGVEQYKKITISN